jgi:trehalose synthase
MGVRSVTVGSFPIERFRGLLGEDYADVQRAVERAAGVFEGRAIWHINSTARGGGVAELLQSLLAYTHGAGVDTRWLVVESDPEFFAVTKRLHNRLHGAAGDGGDLGERERAAYEATLSGAARELRGQVGPLDVVFCHDPQTAGLVPMLARAGARVVWRCHIGVDEPNERAREAWRFLRPYVEAADALVFSRRQFVWEGIDPGRVWIVPPSIDAFSPKNQDLPDDSVAAILGVMGLAEASGPAPEFRRLDGSPARVERRAELDQDGPLPTDAPVIAQVSRWDALKDPAGVLAGFAAHLRDERAHLVLAGPDSSGVTDDPEGTRVLAEVRELRAGLPARVRERTHLACLPMDDVDENAAMVNAIQRRADVIVQKSLAEGFGLTITEAMWKGRPVVASCRGAIQDMIEDGVSGELLRDPTDLRAFAKRCDALLADPGRAARIGAAARERVRERFLGTRHLLQYLDLLEALLEPGRRGTKAPLH